MRIIEFLAVIIKIQIEMSDGSESYEPDEDISEFLIPPEDQMPQEEFSEVVRVVGLPAVVAQLLVLGGEPAAVAPLGVLSHRLLVPLRSGLELVRPIAWEG